MCLTDIIKAADTSYSSLDSVAKTQSSVLQPTFVEKMMPTMPTRDG